ncbi:Hpt domain-containing protein, partial [Actinotalea sp.]|uniref:Hpt domain-containing protein n=1 Tax=Actinotalea sp. TaxID=1872145 RepID=UPI0035690FFC
MEDLDDIVHEFLVESRENLDQLDSDLVALESAPGSRGLLGSIFRTIHTIKGTSGFLAFGRLERLTHAGENLLVELRDGRRTMDQPTTDVLLRMVDTVRVVLDAIESGTGESAVDVAPVVAALEGVLAGSVAAPAPAPAPAAAPAPVPAAAPEQAAEPQESHEPSPERPVAVVGAPTLRVRVKQRPGEARTEPAPPADPPSLTPPADRDPADPPLANDVVPSPHHPVNAPERVEEARPAQP